MNILADEGIDRHIVEHLRLNGHPVIYIAELEPSISDNEVFDRANATESILLTADKDFGEIVFRDDRLISDGVVLIRLAGLTSELKAKIVLEALRNDESMLRGHFTVISPGKIRHRTKDLSLR